MTVTLEWVRDHYDSDNDRYINKDEKNNAFVDWTGRNITLDEFNGVLAAFDNHTLLPDYGFHTMSVIDGHVISINIPSGAMLKVNGVEVI